MGSSRGCGKLRKRPRMENRKGAPLIRSSQLPAPSAALGIQLGREGRSLAGRPALWAGSLGRPRGGALAAPRRGGSGFCQALSARRLHPHTSARFLPPHQSRRWALSGVPRCTECASAQNCTETPSVSFITDRKAPFQVLQEMVSALGIYC